MTSLTRHTAFSLLMLVLVTVVLTGVAAADPSAAEAHFAALADPDYAVREAAMAALLTDDTLSPEVLAEWVPQATELEQRHRLLLLARHHTLRQLREQRFAPDGPGSMGVVQTVQDLPPLAEVEAPTDATDVDGGDGAETQPQAPRACALVTRVLPGFPAAGRLRMHDRIIEVEGRPIPGPANAAVFEVVMRQFAAGHELRLTVLRGDETLAVRIPLTNGRGLGAMYRPPTFELHDAYRDPWLETRDRLFAGLLPVAPADPRQPPRRGPRSIFDSLRD